MEQTNAVDNNGTVKPSAPALNGSQREEHLTHPSLNGTHSAGSVNSGFQDDFNKSSNFEPTTSHTSFMPHEPNTNDSYCGRFLRNRRQASSVAGGLSLMINSGLHFGWGVWRLRNFGIYEFSDNSFLSIFIIMAWSVGAFFGGFTISMLSPMLWKNSIYYLSAAVMIVGNIVLIIWDGEGIQIAVARVLIGFAHGIAFVTLVTHAGENAGNNMRGTMLSIINTMLYSGIFLSLIVTGTMPLDEFFRPTIISAERIIAIVGVVMAVASIGCTIMKDVESVPFLLHENFQREAITNLKELRSSAHETLALKQEMEEMCLMVVQDKQDNWNIFTDGNGKPLVQMIVMRLMVALTNNFLINMIAMLMVVSMFLTLNPLFQYRLVPLIVVAPRLAMSIVQVFYADIVKRKIQLLISSILAPLILIIIGIVWNVAPANTYEQIRAASIAIIILWVLFQFSCSIGMDQMQDVYLSEAFSTAKKRWSLAVVAGVEHSFHIFMVGMYVVGVVSPAHFNAIIFVTASVVLVLGIVFVLILPETRRMSLKEAKDSFLNYSIDITSPFK